MRMTWMWTMRLTFREPGMFSSSKATKHEVAQRSDRRPSSLQELAEDVRK